MVEDRLFAFQHVLAEVAVQFVFLEQLLGVVVLVAEPLVFDAVDDEQPHLVPDDRRHLLDVLLRIVLEVLEPVAARHDLHQRSPGQIRLVLKITHDVRQLIISRLIDSRTFTYLVSLHSTSVHFE